jgi:hypothetical protein
MNRLVREYDEAHAESSKDPEAGHKTSGIEEDA